VRVVIAAGAWQYTCRVVEGTYPNHTQIVPTSESCRDSLTLTPADVELFAAVAEQFPDTDVNHGLVLYADNERVLVLHGQAGQVGQAIHAVLPGAKAKVGDQPLVFAVNRRFLLDGLAMGCLELHAGQPGKPLRCHGPDGALYVLMPLGMGVDDAKAVIKYVKTIPKLNLIPAPQPKEDAMPEKPTTNPPATQPTAETAKPPVPPVKPELTMVEPATPTEALLKAIDEAHETVRAAADTIHGLKRQVRELERQHRSQEREHREASAIIGKLKKVANF
jgi:hypothetical protein